MMITTKNEMTSHTTCKPRTFPSLGTVGESRTMRSLRCDGARLPDDSLVEMRRWRQRQRTESVYRHSWTVRYLGWAGSYHDNYATYIFATCRISGLIDLTWWEVNRSLSCVVRVLSRQSVLVVLPRQLRNLHIRDLSDQWTDRPYMMGSEPITTSTLRWDMRVH
jgi:hypothetical protein